jgi:carboxypeptidase Taq
MNDPSKPYAELIKTMREIALLGSAASVLHWDERTQMPTKGTEHRNNQVSLLSRMVHEQFTSPKVGQLIAAVETPS